MSASEEGKARRVPLRGVGDMGEELSEEKGFDEVEALGDIHWLRNDRIPPPPKDGRRGGSGARGAVRAPRARRGATWLGNGSDRERPRSSACARAAASRAGRRDPSTSLRSLARIRRLSGWPSAASCAEPVGLARSPSESWLLRPAAGRQQIGHRPNCLVMRTQHLGQRRWLHSATLSPVSAVP